MPGSPVVSCGHKGRGYMSYPAIVTAGERVSQRLKLCRTCYQAWHDKVRASLASALDRNELWRERPYQCDWQGSCENGADEAIIYVTTYPDGKERMDFVARLCPDHLADARQMASMAA